MFLPASLRLRNNPSVDCGTKDKAGRALAAMIAYGAAEAGPPRGWMMQARMAGGYR